MKPGFPLSGFSFQGSRTNVTAGGGPGLAPALPINLAQICAGHTTSKTLFSSTIKQQIDAKVLPCSPEVHSFWTEVLFVHPSPISFLLPALSSQDP